MHLPDFFTVLLGYLIAAALSAMLLGLLWRQTGPREPAIGYCLAGSLMHLVAIILFGLRGQVPDFVPIFVGGLLIVGSAIATRNGVAVFLGRPVRWYLWLPVVFLAIHAGFTYLAPDIRARNMNLALVTALLYGEITWLYGRWAPASLRPASTLNQGMAAMLALSSAGILLLYFFIDESWVGTNAQGPASAIALLIYQVFVLGLSVSFVLLVNRRLFNEVEHERDQHQRIGAELKLSEARLQRAELTARVGNWEMDLRAGTFDASVGAEAIYGGKKADYDYATMRALPLPEYRPLIDTALKRAMHEGVSYETEFRIRTLDTGELKDIHSRGAYDAARGVMYGVIQDITERKMYQQQLEKLAHFDVLTGLPNRALLADRLGLAIAQAHRRHQSLAVAFIDLDGFKSVNDNHGHSAGDALLSELSQRMKTTLREGDTLARVGGDEFVAVLVDLDTPQECDQVLQRLIELSSTPMQYNEQRVQVSASIGVTLLTHEASTVDELLHQADQAMYQAKQAGKCRFHWFAPPKSLDTQAQTV